MIVTYRSLAGPEHSATVMVERADGRVDLAVDDGCGGVVELTRIEVVPRDQARPGSCFRRETV